MKIHRLHRTNCLSRILFLIALCVPAIIAFDAAFAGDWEISEEELDRIQRQAIPMPFPEPSTKEIPDQPLRMVYKYNPADWPLEDMTQNAGHIAAPSLALGGEKADDGPLRITETEEYPYSSIVHLYMAYGSYYAGCSGTFVRNSQLILTAAHCIYNHEEGGFPESITVIPAEDGNERPFGSKEAINWATNNSWINWQDYSNDWAVVVVRPFDDDTGFMETHYESGTSWYTSNDFETAGYPGDEGYTGDEMWWDVGQAVYMMYGMIEIGFDFGGEYSCIHGQSGSAMYIVEDGVYKVAAVLTLANCMGPKINNTISNFLDDYDCGGCFIEDTCYLDGDVNTSNPCRICDSAKDLFGWSDNSGAWCDDGEYCNGADECLNQACTVHEGNPCVASQTCDEEADECVGEAIDGDMCNEALNLIYGECGMEITSGGVSSNRDQSFAWCMQNQGPWECIFGCVDHPDVDGCSDLTDCLAEKCDVHTSSGSDSGDDDDDDDGQCGGLL
jgi:V8-like Glu-specific endopeptidase